MSTERISGLASGRDPKGAPVSLTLRAEEDGKMKVRSEIVASNDADTRRIPPADFPPDAKGDLGLEFVAPAFIAGAPFVQPRPTFVPPLICLKAARL